jgi:hypothetical protein
MPRFRNRQPAQEIRRIVSGDGLSQETKAQRLFTETGPMSLKSNISVSRGQPWNAGVGSHFAE